MSQPTVAHWESGAHSPRWALLPRIAALLDMPRGQLTPGGDRPPVGAGSISINRSIPVFRWPRNVCDIDMLVSGTALPVSYVSLSSPGAAPVAIIMEDPDAAAEFPPGSIGFLDLTDRAPKDGSWYLCVVDGAPAMRVWRSSQALSSAMSGSQIWNPATPFATQNAPIGRIVLSIRPH